MFSFLRGGILTGLLLSVLLILFGCERDKPEAALPPPSTVEQPRPRMVVPEDVKGHWKSVSIAVQDKLHNREDVYKIEIGASQPLPQSNISLEVKTFLPHFIMDGTVMTSVSNEAKNPAVQVIVREDDKPVFQGWLFSLYPGTHAFQHPRYSFTLVDFTPVVR